jgi:hypothetical protein
MASNGERVEAQLKLVQGYVEAAGFDDEEMAKQTGISELRFGASDLTPRAIERVFKDHHGLRLSASEQPVSDLEGLDDLAA